MLVNRPPFRSADMGVLVGQITKGRLEVPEWLSADAQGFVRGLLAPVERRLGSARDGAEPVRAAPFLRHVDFDALLLKEVEAPNLPSDGKPTSEGGGSRREAAVESRHQGGIELLRREFTTFAVERQYSEGLASRRASREALSRSSSVDGLNDLAYADWLGELDDSLALQTANSLELSADGHVCAISPPLLRLLGYPRHKLPTLLGRSMLDKPQSLVHPDDHHRFCAAFADATDRRALAIEAT